jgi:hypothetical protein
MTCLDPEQTGGKKQRDEWQKSNNECEKLDYGIDRGGAEEYRIAICVETATTA